MRVPDKIVDVCGSLLFLLSVFVKMDSTSRVTKLRLWFFKVNCNRFPQTSGFIYFPDVVCRSFEKVRFLL